MESSAKLHSDSRSQAAFRAPFCDDGVEAARGGLEAAVVLVDAVRLAKRRFHQEHEAAILPAVRRASCVPLQKVESSQRSTSLAFPIVRYFTKSGNLTEIVATPSHTQSMSQNHK